MKSFKINNNNNHYKNLLKIFILIDMNVRNNKIKILHILQILQLIK